MSFELNDDQKLLQKNVRAFLEKEIAPLVDEYEQKYRLLILYVLRYIEYLSNMLGKYLSLNQGVRSCHTNGYR